ncbi:Dirigent protein 2 [Ananas comosus]|uniref:Dirigent protein n=1 Tax=Ananas comosus TaxID=4615 RepID=A0A199UGS6_ANACO|nr:Dirigent protein 2 [Ananas comosus]
MGSFVPTISFCFLFSVLLFIATCSASYYVRDVDDDGTAHLHFYMHDDYTSPRPTAMRVITAPSMNSESSSPRRFGDIVVLNNVLTEDPSPDSQAIGRAQGFAVRVAEDGIVSDLSLHLAFEDGPLKGSSLAVHGRIAMDQPVRESVVVGGTGHFRLAKGYLLSKNYDYNLKDGGIVEMDVYVSHQH